jgi:hypothetical protein
MRLPCPPPEQTPSSQPPKQNFFQKHVQKHFDIVAATSAALVTGGIKAFPAWLDFHNARRLGGQALLELENGQIHHTTSAGINTWFQNVRDSSGGQFVYDNYASPTENIEAAKQVVAKMANGSDALGNAAGSVLHAAGEIFAVAAALQAGVKIAEDVRQGKVVTVDNGIRLAQIGSAFLAPQLAPYLAVTRSVEYLSRIKTREELASKLEKIEQNQQALNLSGGRKILSNGKWLAVAGAVETSRVLNNWRGNAGNIAQDIRAKFQGASQNQQALLLQEPQELFSHEQGVTIFKGIRAADDLEKRYEEYDNSAFTDAASTLYEAASETAEPLTSEMVQKLALLRVNATASTDQEAAAIVLAIDAITTANDNITASTVTANAPAKEKSVQPDEAATNTIHVFAFNLLSGRQPKTA